MSEEHEPSEFEIAEHRIAGDLRGLTFDYLRDVELTQEQRTRIAQEAAYAASEAIARMEGIADSMDQGEAYYHGFQPIRSGLIETMLPNGGGGIIGTLVTWMPVEAQNQPSEPPWMVIDANGTWVPLAENASVRAYRKKRLA